MPDTLEYSVVSRLFVGSGLFKMRKEDWLIHYKKREKCETWVRVQLQLLAATNEAMPWAVSTTVRCWIGYQVPGYGLRTYGIHHLLGRLSSLQPARGWLSLSCRRIRLPHNSTILTKNYKIMHILEDKLSCLRQPCPFVPMLHKLQEYPSGQRSSKIILQSQRDCNAFMHQHLLSTLTKPLKPYNNFKCIQELNPCSQIQLCAQNTCRCQYRMDHLQNNRGSICSSNVIKHGIRRLRLTSDIIAQW